MCSGEQERYGATTCKLPTTLPMHWAEIAFRLLFPDRAVQGNLNPGHAELHLSTVLATIASTHVHGCEDNGAFTVLCRCNRHTHTVHHSLCHVGC